MSNTVGEPIAVAWKLSAEGTTRWVVAAGGAAANNADGAPIPSLHGAAHDPELGHFVSVASDDTSDLIVGRERGRDWGEEEGGGGWAELRWVFKINVFLFKPKP